MLEYFIHFALAHNQFRIPELLSICELFGYDIELPEEDSERDINRPFMVVKLQNDDVARRIASRCILVKLITSSYNDYAPSFSPINIGNI